MELLFDDVDQHAGEHGGVNSAQPKVGCGLPAFGAPDLRLHRVLARAQKTLDMQMLFDPLEEQLHLPATLVQRGNGQWRQCRIVSQKHQRFANIHTSPQAL